MTTCFKGSKCKEIEERVLHENVQAQSILYSISDEVITNDSLVRIQRKGSRDRVILSKEEIKSLKIGMHCKGKTRIEIK